MKAVLLDAATLGPDIDLSPIESRLDELEVYQHTRLDQLTERVANVPIIITNKVPISRAILQNCQAVFVLASGTNNVDMVAAKALFVPVFNVVDYGSQYVAQHTLMLMLALAGRLPLYQQDLRQGRWQKSPMFCLNDHLTCELTDKNLLIQGAGSIGQKVASLAEALGMRVQFAGRPGKAEDKRPAFNALLHWADVVSFHCPLTPETHHLLDESNLAKVKQGCLVINCARGGVINEADLLLALREDRLGGLAVDSLPNEPPMQGHDLFDALDEPLNLIVTPHNAWIGPKARQAIINKTAQSLNQYLKGLD